MINFPAVAIAIEGRQSARGALGHAQRVRTRGQARARGAEARGVRVAAVGACARQREGGLSIVTT